MNRILPVLLVLAIFIVPDAFAQSMNIDLNNTTSAGATGKLIQLIAIVTVLSLAPSILVMMTSFMRIVIVLSLLRSALGLQQTPPNQVIISLAMFLTLFIMGPAFQKSYEEGLQPLLEERIETQEALGKMGEPFHAFMLDHVRAQDLKLFVDMSPGLVIEKPEDTPYRVLIPGFMISELKRAFEIGFLIFIPFIIIDMLVASILMAMGMMMLPPVMISLPFKIIFFVLIDGWYMLCGSLIRSFGTV